MQRPSIASDPPPIPTTYFPTTSLNVALRFPHQNSLACSTGRSITKITVLEDTGRKLYGSRHQKLKSHNVLMMMTLSMS